MLGLFPQATSLDQCLNQFVDSSCRVYKDWDDFLTNNQLPECTYCYPIEGVYSGDENDNVLLKFGKTPACKITNRVCSALDTASTVVMVSSIDMHVRMCKMHTHLYFLHFCYIHHNHLL
jgi:hypothetical protein